MHDSTDITILLDRSGSMASIQKDVVGGLRTFIKDQQRIGDNATLTLVQFDSLGIDTVHEARPITQVSEFVPFHPRGGTPLLDALGQTLVNTGERLSKLGDKCPDKVLFVILTDGEENSSHEYSRARVKEMIEHQNQVYNWQFVYLGANQDAFSEAGSLGIATRSTASFVASAAGTSSSFATTSANTAAYRTTGGASSLEYTDQQREENMAQ